MRAVPCCASASVCEFIARAGADEAVAFVDPSDGVVAVDFSVANIVVAYVDSETVEIELAWGGCGDCAESASSGLLLLEGGDSATVTWPAGVTWLGTGDVLTPPTLGTVDLVSFLWVCGTNGLYASVVGTS